MLGFNGQEGDLLFMDVYELHCNNAMQAKGRLSLICYARENMNKCDGVSKEDLARRIVKSN